MEKSDVGAHFLQPPATRYSFCYDALLKVTISARNHYKVIDAKHDNVMYKWHHLTEGVNASWQCMNVATVVEQKTSTENII